MNGLSRAIARQDWEVAALYLVLGVARAAARLPAGTAEDLLRVLAHRQRGGA